MNVATVCDAPVISTGEEQQTHDQGSELRCSECYKAEAALVCAQCGALLCSQCVGLPKFHLLSVPNVSVSSESRQLESFVFCSQHQRSTLSVGATIVWVCIATTLVSALTAPWLVLLTAAMTVSAFKLKTFVDRRIAGWSKTESDTFGLFARYRFEMSQHLTLDFDLGSRTYATPTPGGLNLTLSVKLDHGDKDRFMKRGGMSNFRDLHAGFYCMRGVSTRASGFRDNRPRLATAIRGPIPENFLDVVPLRSIGYSAEYEVTEARLEREQPRKRMPFHVVPNENLSSLNPREWGLTFKSRVRGKEMMLKRLIVRVPPELESVPSTDGVFDSEHSRVLWRDIQFNSERPASIQVEFSHPIYTVYEITAEYEVGIDGSGLGDLSVPTSCIWYPSGRRVDPERVTVVQSATIVGTIKAPTSLQPKRQEVIERKTISRPARYLTIELAHKLVAGLSERGLYAKHIFEAPPGTVIIGSSQMTRRYWEVVGRYYVENQPYDVHVVLTGQDQRGQVRASNDVRLDFEVVVRSLSELRLATQESQKVDAVAADLLSVAANILGD